MTLLLVASFWFLFSLAAGWFLGKCMSLLGRDPLGPSEETPPVETVGRVPSPSRPVGLSPLPSPDPGLRAWDMEAELAEVVWIDAYRFDRGDHRPVA